MTDQVNPLGNLAAGLPLAALVVAAARPAPAKVPPAKIAESRPPEEGGRPTADSPMTSEVAIERLNTHFQQTGSQLKFQVDEGSGRTFFQVVSQRTGEIVLQVPSEEVLAMARNVRKLERQMSASGVLMDKEG